MYQNYAIPAGQIKNPTPFGVGFFALCPSVGDSNILIQHAGGVLAARARPSRSAIFAHSRAKMQTSPHSRFDTYTETPSGVSFFACGRGNRGFCDSCQKNSEYLENPTKIQNRRRNRGNSHKNSLCLFRDMLFYTRGETAGACPGGATSCAEDDAAIRPAAVSRGQQMGQEPGEIIWKGS
jgi:hypothetical protein